MYSNSNVSALKIANVFSSQIDVKISLFRDLRYSLVDRHGIKYQLVQSNPCT